MNTEEKNSSFDNEDIEKISSFFQILLEIDHSVSKHTEEKSTND